MGRKEITGLFNSPTATSHWHYFLRIRWTGALHAWSAEIRTLLCFILPTLNILPVMASHGKTSVNASHSKTGAREVFSYEASFFLLKIFGLYLHFETYPNHPPEGSEQDQSFGGICFSSKGWKNCAGNLRHVFKWIIKPDCPHGVWPLVQVGCQYMSI